MPWRLCDSSEIACQTELRSRGKQGTACPLPPLLKSRTSERFLYPFGSGTAQGNMSAVVQQLLGISALQKAQTNVLATTWQRPHIRPSGKARESSFLWYTPAANLEKDFQKTDVGLQEYSVKHQGRYHDYVTIMPSTACNIGHEAIFDKPQEGFTWIVSRSIEYTSVICVETLESQFLRWITSNRSGYSRCYLLRHQCWSKVNQRVQKNHLLKTIFVQGQEGFQKHVWGKISLDIGDKTRSGFSNVLR